MTRHLIRIGCVVLVTAVATIATPASARSEEPPTYEHALGVTFEPVDPSVWKVLDPMAPRDKTGDHPEWHQGVEIAPDGTVWLWGPGGIRQLGDSPIGDDPADWQDSMSGIVSKARGLAVAADGTVWANIDSRIRSWDGTTWSTPGLDLTQVVSTRIEDVYATLLEATPDGSVWAVWEVWYDEGYEYERVLASVDGDAWIVQELAARPRSISGVAGTSDGDTWVVAESDDDPILMYRHEGRWQAMDTPASPAWSGPATGPDGTLWMTVSRPEDPGGCDALARLAQGTWSIHVPDGDEMCGIGLFGLEVGPDGSVWIPGDGVVGYDGTEWRHYLRGAFPMDLDVASDGTVWVAAAEGVFVIRPPAAG
jgi:hypothetical protein